jgi:hypothetical protein
MACPDYLYLGGERNSLTDNFSSKIWPRVLTSGMLRPGGLSPPEPDVISFNCPKCRARLEFADAAAGRIVRCAECRAKLRLPGELSDDEPPRRKKRRRRPVEDEASEPGATPEWLAPTIILALGLTLSVGSLAVAKGQEGATAGLILVGLRLLFTIPLSIGGMFIVAPLLGVSFGSITMAILKLAAINVLTLSIVLNVEFAGGHAMFGYALAAPIVWLIFKWLFELEFNETMISLVVIDVIQFMANLTVTAIALRSGK